MKIVEGEVNASICANLRLKLYLKIQKFVVKLVFREKFYLSIKLIIFLPWQECECEMRHLKMFYSVFYKPPYCTYLCRSRLHSRPLVQAIVPICASAGLRWFSKFSSVIAYYLVSFVFYINNLGVWNTFIATEHLPGRINNFDALWNSIDSFVMIPCPTSFLTTRQCSTVES